MGSCLPCIIHTGYSLGFHEYVCPCPQFRLIVLELGFFTFYFMVLNPSRFYLQLEQYRHHAHLRLISIPTSRH